ncbi:PREDICTED: activating signal cointegrator 1 complex subunit 2 homolog isoform X2 [Populus euphratica]|uniref:Activating signal cointegrator 1 complex subunit 2 homolog isoform X2 n=1 Tax=Populus euphratica TaxID=75702 RepID=A0AAJ6TES4_POPEU|nr:PREDICTED: activating signal cointegrator 1 complex subunit 2 homolog isoform X2 [Populus euphratica]
MGRPEADSSSYETDQPQEHHYEQTSEATQTHDFSSHAYATNYNDSSQQDHYGSQYADTSASNPQDQQPPPPPPPQQQQQYNPPQANQGYGGQPAQPSQFPPQGPQTNPMYSNGPTRPAPYPPQGPQTNPTQPAPYPPQGQQTFQTQPAPYPPQNPMKPAAYPPQSPRTFPNQPAQFPPQSPQTNPIFPNQGPQEMPQAYPPQAFQNSYQAPQAQVAQFPPKSPAPGIPMQVMNQQQQAWTTGIFDCMDDPTNALITALFPCVTFGQVAEIVDNGQTTCGTNGMIYGMVAFCIAMPCIVSCGYRSKLRAKYGLIEDPAPDWLTHCLFEWCALCQEYRELNNRDLDPSIGWQGNLARQNMMQAQVGMVPPTNQRMMP